MLVSGVRSSWDTFETKSDLARSSSSSCSLDLQLDARGRGRSPSANSLSASPSLRISVGPAARARRRAHPRRAGRPRARARRRGCRMLRVTAPAEQRADDAPPSSRSARAAPRSVESLPGPSVRAARTCCRSRSAIVRSIALDRVEAGALPSSSSGRSVAAGTAAVARWPRGRSRSTQARGRRPAAPPARPAPGGRSA